MLEKKIKEAWEQNEQLKPIIEFLKKAVSGDDLKRCPHNIKCLFLFQIRYNNNKKIIIQQVAKIKSKLTFLKKTKVELKKEVKAIDVKIKYVSFCRDCKLNQMNQHRGRGQRNMFYRIPLNDQKICYDLMDEYIDMSNTLHVLNKEKWDQEEELEKTKLEIDICIANLASLTGNPQNNAENVPPASSTYLVNTP